MLLQARCEAEQIGDLLARKIGQVEETVHGCFTVRRGAGKGVSGAELWLALLVMSPSDIEATALPTTFTFSPAHFLTRVPISPTASGHRVIVLRVRSRARTEREFAIHLDQRWYRSECRVV